MILRHRHLGHRAAVSPPVGQQFVERDRIDHRTDRICAPISEPFSRMHGSIGARFGRQLFQPDRRGETSRPPPTITTSYSIDSRSCIFTHPQEDETFAPARHLKLSYPQQRGIMPC
jgi:hypothetical protein